MVTVAIDPGILGCGVAGFDNGVLKKAWYFPNPANKRSGMPVRCLQMGQILWDYVYADEIAFEWPKVYTQGKRSGDPNDLLPLVGVCMAYVALSGAAATSYLPREWKGTIPKSVSASRARACLSAAELGAIEDCAPSLMHNVYDAIGIGLHHLGRFRKMRVIAR